MEENSSSEEDSEVASPFSKHNEDTDDPVEFPSVLEDLDQLMCFSAGSIQCESGGILCGDPFYILKEDEQSKDPSELEKADITSFNKLMDRWEKTGLGSAGTLRTLSTLCTLHS